MTAVRIIFLAVLTLAGHAQADVDLSLTQGGAPTGFGGPDELLVDAADSLLTQQNNDLSPGSSQSKDPLRGFTRPHQTLGEILQDNGDFRRIYDRMAVRQVLQIVWLNSPDLPKAAFPLPEAATSLPPIVNRLLSNSSSTGGSSGGSGGGGGQPPPPTRDRFRFPSIISIPTPAAAPLWAMAAAVLFRRSRHH